MSELWTDMAIWWLRLAAAGGLFLLAGLLLVIACRRPAIRLHAGSWVFAIALLVVPLTLLPGWVKVPWSIQSQKNQVAVAPVRDNPVEVAQAQPEPIDPEIDWAVVDEAPIEATEPAIAPSVPIFAETPPAQPTADFRSRLGLIANNLLLGYAAIVVMLLARLALGQWRLERLWQRSSRPGRELSETFARLVRPLRSQPALRISDRISSPICFGVWRQRILLPGAMADLADEQSLQWIFAHELSHLRRRDPLVSWLVGLAQAVFFFVPWFWKLRRVVRLNQEYLADAAAARASASNNSAADYADFLVRLSCAGRLPVGAAAVKSPSSDLYRRVTMLLQKSGTVETCCPRRWSLLAGGGLLALGIGLAGLHFSTREVAAEPANPPKKESINDIEDEVRRALESLKKGPEAKKEEKPPVDLNPIDEARRAEEALKKAQEELRKNPASEEARKAYEDALKKAKDSAQKRPANPFNPQAIPNFPNFPQLPPIQPLNPEDFDKEVERFNEQLQKMMEELQKQLQNQPGFNRRLPNGFGGLGGLNGLNGFRDLNRRNGEGRLGVRVEKPTPILAEQLDLPAARGIVVIDVVPDSTAAKAGIKVNDILLEIGGKVISNEPAELQRMVREFKPDAKVDVVLLRKGKKETIKDMALPEAKPEAANPFAPRLIFPNIPNNPRFPNGFPPEFFNNGATNSMSVQNVNGDYTVNYKEDGVKVTILGFKDDGGFKATSIEIDDNGKISKATSLEKVEEAYKPFVERVIKKIK